MTRKSEKFHWGQEQDAALAALKEMLAVPPILGFMQDEGEVILDVDAALTGVGCVLQQYQEDDTVLRVLAFASRCLNQAERRYCSSRRELPVLTLALRQFRPYLLGRRFVVCTDNIAVLHLQNASESTGQLAR